VGEELAGDAGHGGVVAGDKGVLVANVVDKGNQRQGIDVLMAAELFY
jgi:hypothetical protein